MSACVCAHYISPLVGYWSLTVFLVICSTDKARDFQMHFLFSKLSNQGLFSSRVEQGPRGEGEGRGGEGRGGEGRGGEGEVERGGRDQL